MSETKLIKFDKTNPEHVANIKSGDYKIHEGGYFSPTKSKTSSAPKASSAPKKKPMREVISSPESLSKFLGSPSKNNDENVSKKTVAKKITTPRKLKPAPEPVKKEAAKPTAKKTTTKKAASKKK